MFLGGFLMVFENVFSNFLANFNNFVDEKYILSDMLLFVKVNGVWKLQLNFLYLIVRKQNLMKLIDI